MKDKTPEPVLDKAGHGVHVAPENRIALLAAAATLVIFLFVRGCRKRR
ncbi:hypothetical protein J7E88_10485 [Streptomyces sp. ISL-10]|nr:hypothetical protein [Streptomyces sp. ISL-10]MBT2365730.1 hypothetical protein [Streptomyces sp. ISL-10]